MIVAKLYTHIRRLAQILHNLTDQPCEGMQLSYRLNTILNL